MSLAEIQPELVHDPLTTTMGKLVTVLSVVVGADVIETCAVALDDASVAKAMELVQRATGWDLEVVKGEVAKCLEETQQWEAKQPVLESTFLNGLFRFLSG